MAETDDKSALEAEARARSGWRGGETHLEQKDAPGHTLPESERDRATDEQGGSTAQPGPIPPPD